MALTRGLFLFLLLENVAFGSFCEGLLFPIEESLETLRKNDRVAVFSAGTWHRGFFRKIRNNRLILVQNTPPHHLSVALGEIDDLQWIDETPSWETSMHMSRQGIREGSQIRVRISRGNGVTQELLGQVERMIDSSRIILRVEGLQYPVTIYLRDVVDLEALPESILHALQHKAKIKNSD